MIPGRLDRRITAVISDTGSDRPAKLKEVTKGTCQDNREDDNAIREC